MTRQNQAAPYAGELHSYPLALRQVGFQ